MSDKMDIKESETGLVRVFHVDLPDEAIERFTVQAGTGEWPLMYGLGAKKLSSTFVDVVSIRDLGEMPLTTYLSQAYSVPPSELSADMDRLNKLRDTVLVLPSQAFAHTAQSLTVRTPLRWIGTYQEIKGRKPGAPVRSKSAKGTLGGGSAKGVSGINPAILRWIMIGAGIVVVAALALALTN